MYASNLSTLNLGVGNNAFITNNMNVGANVSSLSMNTGNITNANTNTSSIQGNTISTGVLYAGAVFYNVQNL